MVVAVVALMAVLLASSSVGYGMMGNGWGWGGGWGWWMVAMMVVPLVLVAVLVLLLVAAFAPRGGSYPPLSPGSFSTSSTALEILDARYSRNEISREEYLQKRADLAGKTPGER